MIVVVTGMVGIDKKKYLQDVCDLAKKRGQSIELFNVGDMMYAEGEDIAPGRILDISRERLHLLRRSVMKDIIARSKDCENVILNTHATFRWRHGLFPAFDFDQMRALKADLYVCLLDSVDAMHVRLLERDHRHHTLKDLLVWREEELLGTEMMARGATPEAKRFCLSRGQDATTVEMLYRLIFESDRRTAYLSFPITHVMHLPDILGEIMAFRNTLKEDFICFDPADLDEFELPYTALRAINAGQEQVEVEVLGQKVKLDCRQLREIEEDINRQIYARDFSLVDQSDMIVSFIPALEDGRAALSSGVERELQHAYEAAKEVFVIWMAKSAPSVFVTQTATRVFYSTQEALKFFRDKGYLQKAK